MSDLENKIWRVAANLRAKHHSSDIAGYLKECQEVGVPVTRENLHFIIARLPAIGHHFVPRHVADFVAQLLEAYSPRNILDPWVDMGLLALPIKERLKPESFTGYTSDDRSLNVWDVLGDANEITLNRSDALQELQDSDARFDAVVGCPPWGLNAKATLKLSIDGTQATIKDEYGHLLILESCRHLDVGGVGVFIVSNGFLLRSGTKGKARHALERLGIRLIAAIELPAGTFQPMTALQAHIVVLQSTTEKSLFTAKYSTDEKHQKELLKNLKAWTDGKSPTLGRIVPSDSFRGFSPVEFAEKLVEQARRMGLVGYSFSEVITEFHSPSSAKQFERFPEKPNAVYLPQMAATPATTTQEALPERLKSYYQLVVNPDVADAAFLARLLNTNFGQLWRDVLRTGETIPRIAKTLLEDSTIFLPPPKSRKLQQDATECQQGISRLLNELRELETQLWKRPANIEKVQATLRTINREDRFQDWIDTLPFPLASILWVCHAEKGTYREQYERKIHFFEALAEFLAVVQLSAFTKSEAIWPETKERLKHALEKHNLSIEMATFGTWKVVIEVLLAETRRILNDQPELCYEMFRTRNRKVLETISAKGIVEVIQSANSIRNNWMGHTGAIREADARAVNEQLASHINTIRGILGVVWEGYELILPGVCKMKAGTFSYTIKRVMGSRTPFSSSGVEMTEAMEDGHLHLWSPDEGRALKLIPLVKVMPSPRTEGNACYFYNRQQKNGIRFLSYHFDTDSEVIQDFPDAADTLKMLKMSDIEN